MARRRATELKILRIEGTAITHISTTGNWIVLEVDSAPVAADSVASFVVEATGRGVSLEDNGDTVTIRGYVSEAEPASAVRKQLASSLEVLAANLGLEPGFTISVDSVAEEDWSQSWREAYQPLRVGRRMVIKPSWHSWPPQDKSLPTYPDDVVIELDPAMAFGTGNHPTTQLLLEVLEDMVEPGYRVADVGCGSGILSIAAAKVGAEYVLATDNDPIAVEVAGDNVARNSVSEQILVTLGEGLTTIEERFDLILANINTPTIIALSRDLATHLKPNCCVAVTGIPCIRSERVASALRKAGLWIEETREKGSWVALIACRRSSC